MRLTPREVLRFGELYRNGGVHEGRQVVPAGWIRASWEPRGRSPWSGDRYGYGWWIREVRSHPAFYAWGYGGQYIFVVPDLEMTVVATSDPDATSRSSAHLQAIHALLADHLIPAAERGSGG